MKEQIYEIIVYIAPLVAGFITSTVIPLIIQRFSKKYIQRKIDELNEGAQLKELKDELRSIKKEILEMRGKLK